VAFGIACRTYSWKSKASLIELVGSPNTAHFHKGDTVYTYFVRIDRQCYDTLGRESGSHADQLLIFINKDGNVSGSMGPIYPLGITPKESRVVQVGQPLIFMQN
jgi:hypothetical protein